MTNKPLHDIKGNGQRIKDLVAIEATEALIDDLNEMDSMLRIVIRDIRTTRLDLAAMCNRREDGEDDE